MSLALLLTFNFWPVNDYKNGRSDVTMCVVGQVFFALSVYACFCWS